jgi:hypothetical protein
MYLVLAEAKSVVCGGEDFGKSSKSLGFSGV